MEPLETVALPSGQSRDDNRTATAVYSSTALNLLADGNMIARRVLRDRGTPRNTVGTYEYNPVNEGVWGGGEEGRLSERAVSMPPVFPIRTKFDVCRPRKYEARVMNHPLRRHEIIIVRDR